METPDQINPLASSFIDQYAILNRSHANGAHIWTLCRMSCEAVSLGGGEVRRLAEACIPRLDTDVIYNRRDAWLGWRVFTKVPEYLLRDENGIQAESHEDVRDLLSYTHFQIVGSRFRQGLLRSRYDVAELLVTWAGNQTSTRRASEQLTDLVGKYVSVSRDVAKLQRAAIRVLRHGDDVPLRLYRMAMVVGMRDWFTDAKRQAART